MDFMDFDENTPEYKYYDDLCLEVSVSNKARCRQCGKQIEKDILRWCSSERDRYESIYVGKKYYHTNCLPPIAGHPIVDYNPKTKSGKLRQMHVNPSKKVEKDLFQSVVDKYVKYRINFDKKGSKQDKNWNPVSDSDSEDETTKQAKKPVKAVKQVAKTAAKKINKRSKDSDDEEEQDNDIELAAYNDSERSKYQKKMEELKSKSVAQLKAILKANNQTQSGTKDILIEKVADGYTLGQIPQCTTCGGGKLRFNKKTGQYSCPGYMEDTDKVDCNAVFEFDQVVRFDWVEE